MQPPKITAGRKWYANPLVYLAGLASAGALIGYVLTRDGKPVTNYPTGNNPAVATVEAQPTATLPQIYFSDGRLASIDCGGCSQEEAQPYLDQVHRQAVAERAQFNGIVSDAYEYVDGKLVKTGGKKLLRAAEGSDSLLRVELECGPCDAETLKVLTEKAEGAYDFIIAAMQPSRKPGLYVTVSQDATRANVTYHNDRDHIAVLRNSQIAFYPWHVTEDFSQMLWESGVKIGIGLEYTDPSEGFLDDFWGATMIQIKGGLKGGSTTGGYSVNRSVAGLAANISNALVKEGFDASKFTQLAQRLEGKKARWEQFKAEAKVVAGRDLPTLDRLDAEVNAYREDIKKPPSGSQSRTINDRSSELARILKEYPELDTPTYRKAYEEQFA